jgi:hypothetical protein
MPKGKLSEEVKKARNAKSKATREAKAKAKADIENKEVKKVKRASQLDDVVDQFNDAIRIQKKGPTMEQRSAQRKTEQLLDEIDKLIPVGKVSIVKDEPLPRTIPSPPPRPVTKRELRTLATPLKPYLYSRTLDQFPVAKVRTRAEVQGKKVQEKKATTPEGLEEGIRFVPPPKKTKKNSKSDQGIIRIKRPGESKANKLAIINGIRLARGYPAYSSYTAYLKDLPKKPRTEAQKEATKKMLNAKKLNREAKSILKKKSIKKK